MLSAAAHKKARQTAAGLFLYLYTEKEAEGGTPPVFIIIICF
jgi:hypothetical protein